VILRKQAGQGMPATDFLTTLFKNSPARHTIFYPDYSYSYYGSDCILALHPVHLKYNHMETNHSKSHLRAVVQQVTNNATSWIGHRHGETKSRISGQTFVCPSEGDLDSIEVFSTHVTNNGPVELTLHSFDIATKTWSPVLESSTVEFTKNNTGQWIAFPLTGLHLQKGMAYGFRLKSETGLIGVGEAAGIHHHIPFADGQEWTASSDDQRGRYYSYLSLAFKVELRA